MAEGTCSFTVVSPLSVFLALRGPPLKMQEDTSVGLGLVNETSCTSDIDVTYGKWSPNTSKPNSEMYVYYTSNKFFDQDPCPVMVQH